MLKEEYRVGPHNHNLYTVLSEKERTIAELLHIPNKGFLVPAPTPNLTAAVWVGKPDGHDESAILAVSQKAYPFIDRMSGNWSIGMERLEIDMHLDRSDQRLELARLAFNAARHPVGEFESAFALLRRFANIPYIPF